MLKRSLAARKTTCSWTDPNKIFYYLAFLIIAQGGGSKMWLSQNFAYRRIEGVTKWLQNLLQKHDVTWLKRWRLISSMNQIYFVIQVKLKNHSHLLYCSALLGSNQLVTYIPNYIDLFNDEDTDKQNYIA